MCSVVSWNIHTEIFVDGWFRDKIFDTEIVAALGRTLSDKTSHLGFSPVNFFTAALAQGALCFFLRDIVTEILAEGFRDKIFGTEIISALGSALGDTNSEVRSRAVEIFTAAMAQGALRFL